MDAVKNDNINRIMPYIKTVDADEVSVLKAGYIVTPEGLFIPFKDNADHHIIFSEYLYNLSGRKKYIDYGSTNGAQELCKLGHAIYCGIKLGDFKINVAIDSRDIGLLLLPSPLDNLTYEQKHAIKTLLDTNVSRFSKEKIINITFGDIVDGIEYTESDIIELINNDTMKISV